MEQESRQAQLDRLQRERSKIMGSVEAMERDLDKISAQNFSKLQEKIDRGKGRLNEIDKEITAGRELQKIEKGEEEGSGRREELISAGLITPFDYNEQKVEEAAQAQATHEFKVMMRKGTFQDDADDDVFARRIQDWKNGTDLVGEEEEDEIDIIEEVEEGEDHDVEEEEEELGVDELEENFFDPELKFSDEEVDFDFDEQLNVVECNECLNVRGVSQVLEVLGKKMEDCDYDLPALLKDCRYNSQRALNLILMEEASMKEKYPKQKCHHRSQPKKQQKKAAKKTEVKKKVAPDPIPLPAPQIDHLEQSNQLASVVLDGHFLSPLEVYDCLFEYQRTGVRWLWELHKQQVGGILADEMGLGKSIQTIVFLYSLLHSKMLNRPVLLICPATVLKQWVSEFHKWAPPFRVCVMHSANNSGVKKNIRVTKEISLLRALTARGTGVVVTTYEAFRRSKDMLLPVKWSYVVLDEGHKIRNPDADISLSCKQINTQHRLILTGTPIQNSLKELWSLMDFVYPGKLGTLPVFQREFEVPIQLGGYVNASPSQVITAFKCSTMLRDLVKPFLLRRLKSDVDVALPGKKEQVMMCRLTDIQVKAYRTWLRSDEVNKILDGKMNALYGISFLRKICNHPDLLKLKQKLSDKEREEFGDFNKSGKMLVLSEMLVAWKREGHRVLIFSQGVQMLEVLVKFAEQMKYRYLRMDGSTPVQNRIPLIDQFNNDPDIFVFILTTRVGGIGVNLTGADRVVIFDPDWNPSTDLQARERAWRIGQKRNVCVYRLVTAGTIEEKVLHRQIYKTFLTQKVLKNPRQRRFFNGKTMADLFSLGKEYSGLDYGNAHSTETSKIFKDVDLEDDRSEEQEHEEGEILETGSVGKAKKKENGNRDDDVLLKTLLGKNERVISALNHEAMVDNQPAEYEILQQEGAEIAKEAVKKLQESQRLVEDAPIYRPTWTGKRGEAGVKIPRFGKNKALIVKDEGLRNDATVVQNGSSGEKRLRVFDNTDRSELIPLGKKTPSSKELLGDIKKRKATEDKEDDKVKQLAKDLRRYMWANGGVCDSEELVEVFGAKMKTPEEKFAFRSILREISDFDKQKKTWTLKQSYK